MRYRSLLLAMALTLFGAVPTLAGPVVLMGIDGEDGGPGGHGPIAVYESVVSSILANASNGGTGILVLGGGKAPFDNVTVWWNTIGADLGVPVTYANGAAIGTVSFAGFQMIAVVSDQSNTPSGGMTAAENTLLTGRASDVASFVNSDGGLFGLSGTGFGAAAYGYLGTIGSFTFGFPAQYSNITPTVEGTAIGITNALDICCWHDEYLTFPSFLNVLATNAADGNAAAIGGEDIIIPGQLTLAPKLALNEPGSSHTVTATVVDGDPPNPPLAGVLVTFTVVSGPNAGETGQDVTDSNGQATFTWVGDGGVGVDSVRACFVDSTVSPPVEGCDYAFKFWDKDCQPNGIPDQCDIACSNFGGLCKKYGCGGSSDNDGNGKPDECNQAPVCSTAVACNPTLWPPNHKYVPVSICGVTDPDGDPVTITVIAITQDEPLNTRGDGNTCPDGQIVGGQASVRAERTGTPGIPGNGRVYRISFTADDGQGGTCSGAVTVCVPHDQGQGNFCIDDGQTYNSLGPCNGGSQLSQEITEVGLTVGTVTGTQAALEFALPKDTQVELSVFDVAGRRLATVAKGSLSAGVYQRSWDMAGATKGLYFVRLRAGAVTLTKTVVKIQ